MLITLKWKLPWLLIHLTIWSAVGNKTVVLFLDGKLDKTDQSLNIHRLLVYSPSPQPAASYLDISLFSSVKNWYFKN